MDDAFDTDYLVVGAGAAGMAFTDALLTHTDASVTLVDRRHAPGGHWVDAYPYVRLHQPSAFYGVDSLPLGQDARDTAGANAGFYELAGPDEIRAYYQHLMHRRFLPSGRVRYLPNCDFVEPVSQGASCVVSRLSPARWTVRVRRKWVDTAYLEGSIPATSAPPFEVAPGVRCVPAGELARLSERPRRYVIIGAGKTALDAVVWLLEQGVPADAVCWVKPREAWWGNRRYYQPHALLPDLYAGMGLQVQAMAQAGSVDDVFARLEAQGLFLRVDTAVVPTMFRGTLLSEGELALLRQVHDVVRLGYVRRITQDEILLDQGRVPTTPDTLHVHCAARGLVRRPLRPIFEADRVTVQPFVWGFACYQYQTLGVLEATEASDEEKNRLCPPLAYWNENVDYLSAFLSMLMLEPARMAHPALAAWAKGSRLNPMAGLAQHRDDPRVADARERIKQYGATAAGNLARLIRAQGPGASPMAAVSPTA